MGVHPGFPHPHKQPFLCPTPLPSTSAPWGFASPAALRLQSSPGPFRLRCRGCCCSLLCWALLLVVGCCSCWAWSAPHPVCQCVGGGGKGVGVVVALYLACVASSQPYGTNCEHTDLRAHNRTSCLPPARLDTATAAAAGFETT